MRQQQEPFQTAFIYTSLIIAIGAGFLLGAHLALPMGFEWNLPQHLSVWIQVHGHLQLVGWAGLFIIGVSLYFIPRFLKTPLPYPKLPRWILFLITIGLMMRSTSEFVIAYTQPSISSRIASVVLPFAAIAEWTGFMLYLFLIARMHAKNETQSEHFKIVKPFFVMMVFGFFVYESLQLVQVFLFDVTERLPWNQFAINLFLAFTLLPLPIAFATRTFPLFLQIPPVQFPLQRLGIAYFLTTVLMLLPETPGVMEFNSSALMSVSNIAQIIRAALIIWMVWEMKLYQKILLSPDSFLLRYFGREYIEARRESTQFQRARKGYFDFGQFGRFELLIHSAFFWLTIYAVFGFVDGAMNLLNATSPFGDDPMRHSFMLGFVTLLIMGMAVRMLPGFVQKNGVAYPNVVVWLAVLGNMAVILRVVPIALHTTWLGNNEKLLETMLYGFGVSGLFALSALMVFSINIVKTMRSRRALTRVGYNFGDSIYYETDHDHLDELFRKFQQLKRTDFPNAKEFFKVFKFGLQRHIIWEEEILFPLFEEKTGMTQGGPTEVMRREHRIIKKHLEAIHEKVKAQKPNSDNDEQMLLNTLFMHNQKEENILYPAIDRLLTDQERAAIFMSMMSISEEKYNICCTPEELKE